MKKLLFILLLVPLVSWADNTWIARAPNKAGGIIVITAVQGSCRKGELAIYSTQPGGNVIWGCAIGTDNNILGYWLHDGTNFAFDYSGWQLNGGANIPKGPTF